MSERKITMRVTDRGPAFQGPVTQLPRIDGAEEIDESPCSITLSNVEDRIEAVRSATEVLARAIAPVLMPSTPEPASNRDSACEPPPQSPLQARLEALDTSLIVVYGQLVDLAQRCTI